MEFDFFDYILLSILIIVLPVYGAWEHRRLHQRLETGKANARIKDYIITMVIEWSLTIIVLAWWLYQRRTLSDLGLGLETDLGWLIGSAVALIACGLYVAQTIGVLGNNKKLEQTREQIEPLRALLPQNRREMRAFYALSITAGICEEILYRGFIFAFFYSLFGPWAAIVLSAIVFGFGHAYQGITGILKTGGAGLVMAGLFLLSGSLWVLMLLHAVVDASGGYLGYRANLLPEGEISADSPE
jgi:membrane protease YdiL (CAAX protease family)